MSTEDTKQPAAVSTSEKAKKDVKANTASKKTAQTHAIDSMKAELDDSRSSRSVWPD